MSEVTPGQAAYERWHTVGRRLIAVQWAALDKFDRMYWDEIAEAAVAAEREACAQVCESRSTPGTGSVAILNGAAEAIRARGKP